MSLGIDAVLGSETNPVRVAILGSGPSGFYAAEALFKSANAVRVDMFERLPVPFGLVRYGVAPDHPKLKQVSLVFDKIAQTPGFEFLGNVAVGRDVSLSQLKQTHHVIIVACGADSDRRLGVANEDVPGSHTATAFVGWYNGHPYYRDHRFDLSGDTAVIVGQGNVAIDVARILAKSVDELGKTDISAHALDVLAESRVRNIHVVGRRGPAQSSFTNKELRELGELPNCHLRVTGTALQLGAACVSEISAIANTNAAANVDTFRKWANAAHGGVASKTIHFHFHKSPVALEGGTRLQRVVLEQNTLRGEPFGQRACGTGRLIDLPCELLFRSIGYRGQAIPGVPFDDKRGVIQHIDGRVQGEPGIYATGWIKRGPSGIIGTNRLDAVETVKAILQDLPRMSAAPKPGAAGLHSVLMDAKTRVTHYGDWQRIDAEERRLGAAVNKPREKITRIDDMLALAHLAHP